MFRGSIPQCIGNVSRELIVLDICMNKLEGTIPTNISSNWLTTLNLHGNHLRGNIPSSLATCVNLKVLDLGNNNLNAPFPSWLGFLPDLTVLSLRSNKFHGKIRLSTTSSFPKLKMIDLSHNQFIGTLHQCSSKVSRLETSGHGLWCWSGGALMFLTEKPKWLTIMVEEEGYRIEMKIKRNKKKKALKRTGRKN
ncbi:hypothetical protein LIER_14615 [Lithospermum erythrorhizon]|uniref:Uncharacterized protein n=1 Tax=Lithospermum erythrorhizon TaxID=34254 RepID=A0AAV3Q1D7_LITER